MRILIGADIVPTKKNIDYFISGDVDTIIGKELDSVLSQADFRIFNLETPLTDIKTPIKKCGEALSAPVQCVEGLKALHIDLLTLCNNHIMDQGIQGLKSTMNTLQKAQIAYVGVGSSREEAAKPYIFELDGKVLGVYACTEHEFSIVDDEVPGANPIDLLECFGHIKELKRKCDFVIVLYHGGKEQYRYPSPNLQKICHKFVEEGSDLVICQHSHCIGSEEKYKQKTIIYGQGNFIFDDVDNEYWQTSLLVQITDGFKISYIPLKKEEKGVRLADESTGKDIMSDFCKRNHEIENPFIIQKKYDELASNYITEFLSVAAGKKYSLLTRTINRLIGNNKVVKRYIEKKYTEKKRLTLLNRVECEAYNELFIYGLKRSIKNK